ncbi:hypothetical protein M0813_03969 [Anaeramoeba flamelloides]|uniref:Uncharacterized protein n=1 Tax=Anaeramoeba flamelloides TaxID=1746091 RepID=A0ABQ8XQ82_9EUKA|nr:hypothetical protein M0813_03969 [Anaeramoeba flamelloides]
MSKEKKLKAEIVFESDETRVLRNKIRNQEEQEELDEKKKTRKGTRKKKKKNKSLRIGNWQLDSESSNLNWQLGLWTLVC